jgi:hypothetical protein
MREFPQPVLLLLSLADSCSLNYPSREFSYPPDFQYASPTANGRPCSILNARYRMNARPHVLHWGKARFCLRRPCEKRMPLLRYALTDRSRAYLSYKAKSNIRYRSKAARFLERSVVFPQNLSRRQADRHAAAIFSNAQGTIRARSHAFRTHQSSIFPRVLIILSGRRGHHSTLPLFRATNDSASSLLSNSPDGLIGASGGYSDRRNSPFLPNHP